MVQKIIVFGYAVKHFFHLIFFRNFRELVGFNSYHTICENKLNIPKPEIENLKHLIFALVEIKSAEFKISTENRIGCPKSLFLEFAFIGRSNVGKSSLINMLCEKKELARTSSTPGKTISMNYFLINNKWFLVDLPGYGYAKRSKEMRGKWEITLVDYLRNRENLQCLFVLVDSRIKPQTSDLSFINMLGKMQVPFSIVFTKLDKLKSDVSQKNISEFKEALLDDWENLPTFFETSAKVKIGRKEILRYISSILK